MNNELKTGHDGYIELQVNADSLSFNMVLENGSVQNHPLPFSIVKNVFTRYGLSEEGLETVINHVEDLIMPVIRHLPKCAVLKVSGLELQNVVHLLSTTSSEGVSIDAVESLYKSLEAYVEGSSVAWRQQVLPEDIALGLIVLREVMHHGGFRSVFD